MANLTINEIAKYFVNHKETETANFINSKASKIYCASYSRGTYGKIFLNFIKNTYPINLDFNGTLTDLAICITDELQNIGYSFQVQNNTVQFIKS
jgi:hypothetical protein